MDTGAVITFIICLLLVGLFCLYVANHLEDGSKNNEKTNATD